MKNTTFSIIIPVFNDAEDLELVLNSLKDQILTKDEYEVIVVDNMSTDYTISVAAKYSFVKLISEKQYLNSPYSCRNRGIEIAKGESIIFLDATCIPGRGWLQAYKNSFEQSKADLIGGKVSFRFQNKLPTAAEYFDSISNIRMKQSIEERGVAKTANLAVKRKVINEIGMFEEGRRSGGDVIWTQKAVSKGFKIVYSEDAEVLKKARRFNELIKKQWRVSKAQPSIWQEQGINVTNLFLVKGFIVTLIKSILKSFIVLFGKICKRLLSKKYNKLCKNEIFGMTYIPMTVQIIMRFGNMLGYNKSKINYLKRN